VVADFFSEDFAADLGLSESAEEFFVGTISGVLLWSGYARPRAATTRKITKNLSSVLLWLRRTSSGGCLQKACRTVS